MRSPTLLAAALLLVLAGCTVPPPEAYLRGSRIVDAELTELGPNTRGEPCRMLRTGTGAEVLCGTWEAPSARIAVVATAPLPVLAEQARAALSGRLSCDEPSRTSTLNQPGLLMGCRWRTGGWPAFALVAAAGTKAYQIEGVLPALPAAERGMGILAGLVAADAPLPRSASLDLLAARLSRTDFGADDIARYEQLLALGRDANQAERFAAAETAYRGALTLQERLLGRGNPDSFAPLTRLALQVSNQGRYAEAEALLARAEPLAPRASDPLASAQLAHYRGLHEANRGRTDSAARLLAEAEARFTGALPPDLRSGPRPGIAMGGLVADPVAARALVGLLEAQRNRAAVLRSAGRTRDAEIATSQANALSAAAPGMVGADLIAARLARTGGAVMASSGAAGAADASFGRSAQRFARGIPRSRPYADTLLLRVASLSASSAAPSRLLPLCREATQVLRTLREGTSGERVASCVDAFIAASNGTEQPLLAEAFETAQLAQGDVTTTQIARAAARLTEGSRDPAVSDAIRKREDAARELSRLFRERDLAGGTGGAASATALAELDAQIEAAQTAAGEAEEAVQAAAPGYAQLVQSVSSAAEVLAALGRGEALATMFIPPSGLGWTFLLADGRITAGRIALELAGIAALVAELRVTVEEGDDSRPFAAEAAWKLHQAVFAQVSAPLGAARRLVVSPAGPLLQLPFGMLVEAPPPAPAGHDGVRFMLARLPVAHVPAPSSLVALRRIGPSRAARPWIGFGDPRPVPPVQAARSFPADPSCGRLLADLPALRATRAQMLVSQELMGARPSEVRMGDAFTLAAVRAASLRDYRVVHFATHGVLPQDLSCLSEPALIASVPAGAGSAEAALLTSDTVLGLDLDADAVVLSACNSGGGTAAGESLSSLARSFFYAGARSLVVTHWYVNEVTAARTVAVMLQNLRDGADSAEALRAAQLRLIRDVPRAAHPAYWAPFAVIGTTPGRATTTVQLGTEGRS